MILGFQNFQLVSNGQPFIGSLHAVQEQNQGYLTPELMNAVADYLDLPHIYIYEVATFYSMFQTEPVGRNEIAICTNISCMLSGSDVIVQHIEDRLNIKLGESTKDGNIFLKKRRRMFGSMHRGTNDDGKIINILRIWILKRSTRF